MNHNVELICTAIVVVFVVGVYFFVSSLFSTKRKIEIKLYNIEFRCKNVISEYRFYSLYNGARGKWFFDKNKAIEEGEQHSRIIKSFYANRICWV